MEIKNMKKNTLNNLYLNLSDEIKQCIERKLYQYYDLEKQNTIIFIPLYSCILQGGGSNHFQPLIPFNQYFVLQTILNDFNKTYIFPGYFRDIDEITKIQFENMLKIISMYHTMFDKSISFNSDTKLELDNFITYFEKIKIQQKAPGYKDIFEGSNVMFCIGLEETIENITEILSKQNKNLKPIIILPRDDVFRCNYSDIDNGLNVTEQNINKINQIKKRYNAKIFLTTNNAGKDSHCEGIALRFYEDLFNNKFPIIKSPDDFATIYSKIILTEAKKAINFNELIESIYNGKLGTTQEEIINNINNIDIKLIKKTPPTKKYTIAN